MKELLSTLCTTITSGMLDIASIQSSVVTVNNAKSTCIRSLSDAACNLAALISELPDEADPLPDTGGGGDAGGMDNPGTTGQL